eukprot:1384646-Prymnesium_polylepis.1
MAHTRRASRARLLCRSSCAEVPSGSRVSHARTGTSIPAGPSPDPRAVSALGAQPRATVRGESDP